MSVVYYPPTAAGTGPATNVAVVDSVLPDGAATSAHQTDGDAKVQIVDSNVNSITSELDPDGAYRLSVGMIQSVHADAGNSSTANLNAGATFTGTKHSTLGIAGIQVVLYATQNCTVYVDQSGDGTNYDVVDSYNYYANTTTFGVTVQAVGSDYRVRVTNNGSAATTTLRLETCLCPIVEAVPRSLDEYGYFKVSVKSVKDLYGWEAENTPMGEMRVVEPTRLVGAAFDGAGNAGAVDSNFWTATVANSATIVQANAEVTLSSGTNSAGSAKLATVRRARYVSANALGFRGVIQLGDTGVASNTRKWGVGWGATMPTITDGAYFQLSGTTFSVVTLKGGSPTAVNSGDFNGSLGKTYSLGTSAVTYEIYWTNTKVYFVIGGTLLHTVSATSTTWAATMSHHVYFENVNAGSTTNSTLAVRVASIRRLGPFMTQPQYGRISGNAATWVFKYGPGILHKLIFNNTSGTSFIVYDNTAASGSTIANVTTASAALGEWTYELPFNTGLTIITTGNGLDLTVVYE